MAANTVAEATPIPQAWVEFLRVYEERFAKAHGPRRPVVERVRRGFMRCGLVEHGSARLWCGACRTSVSRQRR